MKISKDVEKRFSHFLGVNHTILIKMGLLNQPLLRDDPYYLDIFKFKGAEIEEFKDCYDKFIKHFETFFKLLKGSKKNPIQNLTYEDLNEKDTSELKKLLKQGDPLFMAACQRLELKELDGFNLGYSKSLAGSSIGIRFQCLLLKAATELLSLDIDDPEVFCLLPFLQEGIGCDRISDMFISINYHEFLKFTSRCLNEMKIKSKLHDLDGEEISYVKPSQFKSPMILIPKRFVKRLPTHIGWDEIFYTYDENSALRAKLNQLILSRFKSKKDVTKARVCEILRDNPRFLKQIVQDFKNTTSVTKLEKEFLTEIEEEIERDAIPVLADLKGKVFYIQNKFKWFVEKKGTWRLFYTKGPGADSTKHPLSEDHIQRAFYIIAEILAEKLEISVTPEADTGIGIVDFKFSDGKNTVLIEVKLSTHREIVHGFETQLSEYIHAEKAMFSYLMLVVLENTPKSIMMADLRRIDRLKQAVKRIKAADKAVFYVDARPKVSASKIQKSDS